MVKILKLLYLNKYITTLKTIDSQQESRALIHHCGFLDLWMASQSNGQKHETFKFLLQIS